MNYIVWGLPAGETERHMEALLAETCRTVADVRKAKDAATQDGWHSFRVAEYNGEAPDFAKTVRS